MGSIARAQFLADRPPALVHNLRKQIERLGDFIIDAGVGGDAQNFDIRGPQHRQRLTPGQFIQVENMRQHNDAQHMRLNAIGLQTLLAGALRHGDADFHHAGAGDHTGETIPHADAVDHVQGARLGIFGRLNIDPFRRTSGDRGAPERIRLVHAFLYVDFRKVARRFSHGENILATHGRHWTDCIIAGAQRIDRLFKRANRLLEV